MAILEKEELEKRLREYYVSVCGERETDVWYEQPAANVGARCGHGGKSGHYAKPHPCAAVGGYG